LKKFLKKIAGYSGLFRISSWIYKNLLNILMYHGLSPDINSEGLVNFDGKHLKVGEFEKHLKIITKYCNPISLEEAISNHNLPPNPIVLTFDDGYKNNYTYAYPLLKKYNVPVTIFLTTGFIDQSNYMWSDRLEYIINKAQTGNLDFLWEDDKLQLALNTEIEKIKSIRSVKNYMKGLSEQKKLSFIEKLQKLLEIEYNWTKIPEVLLPLTWDEIRIMKDSGLVSFGSHTVTHPILSKCTLEQQRNELMVSQKRIKEELGEECILFAYPNGKQIDYNLKTIQLLKELRYSAAVTIIPGYIEKNCRDNFQLNRWGAGINLQNLGTIISGFSHLVGTI
jgi:peptidoglycan/xylan/chitin deacetylase (PgdA/CDA1 family)